MFKAVVGHSNDPDSQEAVLEVLKQMHCALAGASPKAGILFAAIDFDHALILREIIKAFPEIALIGGTTDGEISSVLGFEQDSLTLIAFCSDSITISAGIGQEVSKGEQAAAQAAVQQAIAAHPEEIQLCISLPESLTTSGVTIIESLKEALGKQVPIFGGLTADQWRSQQTYQFFQAEVHSDAVPVLLFSGPILFSHGVASGWQPIGTAGRVTKAKRNVVYEIDDQPALSFYQRYLGALPPSSEYPLALSDSNSDLQYMRAPSGIYDRSTGSITFFGDVPTQSMVQITEATHDSILLASQQSTQQALETYPGQMPAAALFFSCASRRQILGSRTKEEFDQAQRYLTQSSPVQALPSCGFYANGEISPLQHKGETYLHNETFITLLLGEA
ncbi:MAG: FIST N-terminal domain-containing protein [Phormidesmis sp.]